jgi:hypothetical protein
LFQCVTTQAPASSTASTIGTASGEEFGSTLMMVFGPLLARAALIAAIPFWLSPSVV